MLREILGFSAESEDAPVTSEMLTELTAIFADGREGSYDADEVLFTLALSVIRLETALIESRSETRELKAYVFDLETRVLEAGLPLGEPG